MPSEGLSEDRRRQQRSNAGVASQMVMSVMPAGHPTSWNAINAGTSLAGTPYPHPVPQYHGAGRVVMERAS